MCRLVLVRHVPSTWSERGILQGWKDPPLSENGRETLPRVAYLVGRACEGKAEIVFSSDRARAVSTATYIAEALGLGDVAIREELRELSLGDWEGRREAELEEDPKLRDSYRRLDPDLQWPGARESLSGRALAAFQLVRSAIHGGTLSGLIVVSHGLVLQELLSLLVLGESGHAREFPLAAGSVSALDYDFKTGLATVAWLSVRPESLDVADTGKLNEGEKGPPGELPR